MKYNFKGYVFLGIDCNGASHSYEDLVPVELTDAETQQLRTQVQPDADGDIVPYLQQHHPALFLKIHQEAALFATYATLHEGIADGTLEEYLPEGKTVESFIQEDIDAGRYAGTPGDIRQWYKWEEEYLRTLTYADRIQYITDRYLSEADAKAIDDIDNEYTLELPDALK